MPTPASQITGSYTSGIKYEDYDLKRLTIEYDSLCRREAQLVAAQEQRRKSSEVQAFWWGFGNGDGIEASELANVRGEKEACRHAMDLKGYKPAERADLLRYAIGQDGNQTATRLRAHSECSDSCIVHHSGLELD